MHLGVYAANVGFVFAALVLLGGCGWVAVAPFRDRLSFPLLVAPLAGLLGVLPVTLGLYVLLKLPLATAGVGAIGALLAASALAWWLEPPAARPPAGVASLVAAALVTGLAVGWVLAATVRAGEPALVYVDGTDHLGYAYLADWLNTHLITQPPVADPARPYESWPALLFQTDPRFGSFALVALVSAATGQSGMFSYDLAAALIHAAAVLAVAGVFARSRLTLGFLLAGLFTCHWFDYGRTGFLGKNLGYPAAILLVALLLVALAETEVRLSRLLALAGLALGAAVVHSGASVALMLGVVGAGFLLAEAAGPGRVDFRARLPGLMRKAAVLVLLAALALMAGGTMARPLAVRYPDWGVAWADILPRVAELENQGVGLSGFTPGLLRAATVVTFAAWVLGAVVARARAERAAVAVLAAPLVLLAGLVAANLGALAFQLIGVFYPLVLAGFVLVLDGLTDRAVPARAVAPRVAALALAAATVVLGLHLFRFAGATSRYGGGQTPPAARYTRSELDALAALVGRDRVDVEITAPQPAIVLLVELGRRGVALQWSPESWRTILGYRKEWMPPHYASPGRWRIVPAGSAGVAPDQVAFRSAQYWVVGR